MLAVGLTTHKTSMDVAVEPVSCFNFPPPVKWLNSNVNRLFKELLRTMLKVESVPRNQPI